MARQRAICGFPISNTIDVMARGKATSHAGFDAALGLGSNIGDKAGNIARAVELLTKDGAIQLVKRSRDYRSPPWGVVEQEPFVNACITVATKLTPHELLARCQKVENDMGRVRHQKWGPRIIDVDVLTYRDQQVREADLIVPHPYIGERAFVLMPLRDVAPNLTIDGLPLDVLIANMDTAGVAPLR